MARRTGRTTKTPTATVFSTPTAPRDYIVAIVTRPYPQKVAGKKRAVCMGFDSSHADAFVHARSLHRRADVDLPTRPAFAPVTVSCGDCVYDLDPPGRAHHRPAFERRTIDHNHDTLRKPLAFSSVERGRETIRMLFARRLIVSIGLRRTPLLHGFGAFKLDAPFRYVEAVYAIGRALGAFVMRPTFWARRYVMGIGLAGLLNIAAYFGYFRQVGGFWFGIAQLAAFVAIFALLLGKENARLL